MATGEDIGPDNPSSDYAAMSDYWAMVEAINGGAAAMRANGSTFLPRFVKEGNESYERRRKNAPFTNIYSDVSRSLAAKPFGRELTIEKDKPSSDGASLIVADAPPDAPTIYEQLCEDIDGQGNNLHVFGAATFQYGLDKAVDWILVDYANAQPPDGVKRTVAQEQAAGLRPYWVHVSAERLLAVYSDIIDGSEQIIHARIREDVVQRQAWGEVTKNRVRVFDRAPVDGGGYAPATFEVFEKQQVTGPGGTSTNSWVSIEGPSPITIGVIALVPFLTGRRIGSTWQVRPPLRDIAYLQVEEFQQESNLKNIQELTCFPMLSAAGIRDTDDDGKPIVVPVGPHAVLFSPPDNNGAHGEWKFIEPSAESIKTLMAQLEATQKNMRDLGMLPLTTANLTVITTANVASKAHSQVQAWAIGLKDALEQAFRFTAMYFNEPVTAAPNVDIYTDFGVDMEAGTELEVLNKAQGQAILSKRTVQEEFKRRGVLSDSFDPDEEAKRIAMEEQADALFGEQAIDPVTGEVIEPSSARPLVVAKAPDVPAVLPAQNGPLANH